MSVTSMITRITVLLLISTTVTTLVRGEKCTTGLQVSEIVQKCFEATYELIRRGYADDIATNHLQSVIGDIVRHVTTSNTSLQLGSSCIPTELFGQLFTVKWTTLQTEATLDDMLLSISNSFFDATKVDKALPALTTNQKSEKDAHWAVIAEELSKTTVELNQSRFTYPSTVRHAHDDKYDEVCTEWYKQETSGGPSTPASQGLRQILKLAIQLIMVGCDSNGSWQILRREEGDELRIPDTYMEEYTTAGFQLMEDARKVKKLQKAIPFSEEAFDAMFKTIWQRFSTFGSWGTADFMFSTDVVIKNLQSFISKTVMEELSALNKILASNNLNSTSMRMVGHQGPDCMTSENFNNNMMCETLGDYCYYNTGRNVKSWYENCCNVLICTNAVAILPAMENFDDCCKRCNQFKCQRALLKNDDLKIPHTYDISFSIIHIYLW